MSQAFNESTYLFTRSVIAVLMNSFIYMVFIYLYLFAGYYLPQFISKGLFTKTFVP